MDKKLDKYQMHLLEMNVRQLEATAQSLGHLNNLFIYFRNQGIQLDTTGYILDLIGAYLIGYYGGDIKAAEKLKSVSTETLQKAMESKKGLKEELKEMGIDFNTDLSKYKNPKAEKIDINKMKLDDIDFNKIPQYVVDKWMKEHMDEVIDRYLEKKKEKKDDKNK